MIETIHLQLLLATFAGWVGRQQTAVIAYLVEERSHQGIGNELISGVAPRDAGSIEVRERLGGLLKYYYRRAA